MQCGDILKFPFPPLIRDTMAMVPHRLQSHFPIRGIGSSRYPSHLVESGQTGIRNTRPGVSVRGQRLYNGLMSHRSFIPLQCQTFIQGLPVLYALFLRMKNDYIHMEWSMQVFSSLSLVGQLTAAEWSNDEVMMVARERSNYSVCWRMMMRMMTATTAQTTPIMIIFYRAGEKDGDTKRHKVYDRAQEHWYKPTNQTPAQLSTLNLNCLFSGDLSTTE